MTARYTSPALSRRLRDAGLEQDITPAASHYHDAMGRIPAEDEVCHDEECWQFRNCCRALDLTDVLKELTREREGGALVVQVSLFTPGVTEGRDSCRVKTPSGWDDGHASTLTEAAGLVLAQLLEARR